MPSVAPAVPNPTIAREFLVHHRICPRSLESNGPLRVAVASDSIREGLDDLAVAFNRPVVAEPVQPQELDLLIARYCHGEADGIDLVATGFEGDSFTRDVRDLANQAPVVRYVNLLIREAHESAASDIHLEASRSGLRTRFRVDGVLLPGVAPPPQLDRAVVSRIKLLADLDIADRRRPQDGRIRVRLNDRELDLRVATAPTTFGETVVLRLLDRGGAGVRLADLGLSAELLEQFRTLAVQPHGMVLATGPTGSGKTTTLYAALGLRDAGSEKIITLEDPVEYVLEGVTQVPVQSQVGLTFAAGLRSILRQDPDVVLVGEMRDTETAELAIQAALTGHAVFSTLHTNDALGAIPRLLDLGIPPYLVAATLEAVLAQRLARRICDQCRERYRPDPRTIALFAESAIEGGPVDFVRGRGCPACRETGFRGRIGLFELLLATDALRDAIVAAPTRRGLHDVARQQGMRSLKSDGWRQVVAGATTLEEVLRVTQG